MLDAVSDSASIMLISAVKAANDSNDAITPSMSIVISTRNSSTITNTNSTTIK
jgi:hypothetical protein